jgi:asparagine synthase (glutamine-hydrolysing)
MCGIAGMISSETIRPDDIETIKSMNTVQRHRGPDDEGVFFDDSCVLGHRRLSIIDLSQDGHQPFFSLDKRYVLVFNGEIYNYIELRQELIGLGRRFTTKTDTEVLLQAYEAFGEKCLEKLNGMFAFAVYDTKRNSLFLARDHVGIKPLYYCRCGTTLYFASEIKALKIVPGIRLTTDKQSLFEYLCFNRTDIRDETFYNEIKRIPKGSYAVYESGEMKLHQWWDATTFANINNIDNEETVLRTVHDILVSAVAMQMQSDVPVGSCLSGGLDSSILVGLIYKNFPALNGYKTFTASFPGYSIDETSYVDTLNRKYPFSNFKTFPSAGRAFDSLRNFVYSNDEPTTFPSFYSQYEVMKLAHENGITVLIDGQGGDENFAGYQYFHGFNFTGLLRRRKYPALCSELVRCFTRKQEKEAFETFVFQNVPDFLKKKLLMGAVPYLQKDFFQSCIGESVIFNDFFTAQDLNTSIVRHFQYKLEHLLRMEDRNSMAFSVEARVPYLDHRLVEYLLSVPGQLKIARGETKVLQKKALGTYTVPEILARKDKIGFGTPGEHWMKEKNWADLTKESYALVRRKFPEIFVKNGALKDNPYDKWKINQVATWLTL